MKLFVDHIYYSQKVLTIVIRNHQLIFFGSKDLFHRYFHSFMTEYDTIAGSSSQLAIWKHLLTRAIEGDYHQYWTQEVTSHCQVDYTLGTSFQKEVWQAMNTIAWGQKLTYSDLADFMGKPKSVRAIAHAVALNPLLIIQPCHRIVPKYGGVGQYSGGQSLKEKLLKMEAGD